MTYRRFAWCEIGWGGAATVLASMALAGCAGGGGGGCPEIEGSWSVQSTCQGAPTSCEIQQDGCQIELECGGMTLEGKVSKSSVSFKDEDISCSGKLEGLEDEDEDGFIYPTLEADCTLAGDMCEVEAMCFQGDCTEPEEDGEDNGGDGDGDGDGPFPAGQGGGAGSFSGSGGFSGTSGAGGFSGAGAGGFSGIGGEGGISGEGGAGGFSGEGGAPAGAGGIGGNSGFGGFGGGTVAMAISPQACGGCIESTCSFELASCTDANGCQQVLSCQVSSGCSQENSTCVLDACGQLMSGLTAEGQQAGVAAIDCMVDYCFSDCFSDDVVAPPTQQECDMCEYWGDGVCDDGSQGGTAYCELGSDCTDCGNAGQ
jgi:hypothetical protein